MNYLDTGQFIQNQPINFHAFIVKGVFNTITNLSGWRIVGIWGDEDKGEGMRIGPTFAEDELEGCEKLADELKTKYGLPVSISTIFSHFSGIKVGSKLNTTDGIGIVLEIRPGVLPILVRLDNGGMAWENQSNVISIIET